jgi:hypothetical protein
MLQQLTRDRSESDNSTDEDDVIIPSQGLNEDDHVDDTLGHDDDLPDLDSDNATVSTEAADVLASASSNMVSLRPF